MSNQHVQVPLEERFWPKVDREHASGCWPWMGGIDAYGYGRIYWQRRSQPAHRVSWQILRGPVPDGLEVCHDCPGGDNPACVNPAHLWLGTHAENMADMRAKGRWFRARGEANGAAKLSEQSVREILADLAAGRRACDVARARAMPATLVYELASGRTWRHVS